jgi:AraC-like DNA-binding protein
MISPIRNSSLLKKAVFSSHDLPTHLDERHRFSQWQDIHVAEIWSVEYGLSGNVAFEAAIEAAPIGELVYGQMSGTIKHATRRASNIAEDGRDGYLLLVNAGETTLSGVQVGREFSVGCGEAALVSAAEPLRMVGADKNVWMNVVTPRHALADAFSSVDDLLAYRIAADNEALGLLKRYLQMLETGPTLTSPDVEAHASATIIDLIGLTIGAKGEAAELAGVGGLRSARLQAVLGHIRARYTDVAFSTRDVATALGISARYVNDILQETGSGFAERVLELRLQRARAMLADPRCAMRIGEIAFAAGFADISHFNRSFRQRFGMTPTAAR